MKPGNVVLAAILVIVLLGVLGKVTTAGYHCHWIRVGDSQVCQLWAGSPRPPPSCSCC